MKPEVQIAYTLRERQVLETCPWADGMTAGDAWRASRMSGSFPELGSHPEFGRNGLRIEWTTPVEAGDRIDILRPLLITPLDARRRRAEVQAKRRQT